MAIAQEKRLKIRKCLRLMIIDDMRRLGEQSSLCEHRADEATRDVMLWLKCEYMLDKLGETYAE